VDCNAHTRDRQRVRLVAEASCSQQCGGASERLTDAAKEGTEGQAGSDLLREREREGGEREDNQSGRRVSEGGNGSK
jgi:hypothetical protein